MSCAFRALPRIIPNILLSARKNTNVVIISPWVQELELKIPLLTPNFKRSNAGKMYLSDYLLYLAEKRGLQIFLVVRENDKRVQYATRMIRKKMPASLHLFESEYLHAKAVISNSLVLLTSANLIPTSLYRNIESCTISENPYRNALSYVEHEYKLNLR